MNRWTSSSVTVTGGQLAYHRRRGDGPALVVSHGLTDNGLCWSRFAASLDAAFDIIMLDARGHGASSRIRAGEDFDPARDLAEAIDSLGLKGPILMGHSVGGRASARCANLWPERVSKVILEDPAFVTTPDKDAMRRRAEKFRRHVDALRQMSQAEILAEGRESSPGWHDDDFPAWAAAKHEVDPAALPHYPGPWQQDIERITAPTLVVHGEGRRGSLITPAVAEEIRALNPNIRTAEIPDAGHNVRRENFAGFLQAVQGFLDGPSSAKT